MIGRTTICLIFAIVPLLTRDLATAAEPKRLDTEALKRVAADFAQADVDRDGQLSLDEFLATCPQAERADRRRRFLVFDFDANGKLDGNEFENYACPIDERQNIPDPMIEVRDAAFQKWEPIFAHSDTNDDGALSFAEWPAAPLAAQIPALAEVPFFLCDRQGDGKIDRADARWLFDVAYGMTQLDGRPLRTSTGRVFSWYYFRNLDANGNGLVSRQEFAARHRAANNADMFAQLDADEDGNLTDRETWSFLWHDTIGEFLAYDRDQDGYLSTAEMLGIGWGRCIARSCVRAFDDDGDGRLSFREFRQTTFANQASDWPLRQDKDGDGVIDWSEFYANKPLLVGQARFFFDRFDRNRDGVLSPFEYAVENDPDHARLLAYLETLEQCLTLEVKVAGQVCRLTDEQAAAIEPAGRAAIERLGEEMDATMRKPLEAGDVADRYAELMLPVAEAVHSPHLLLRRKLSETLRASPDADVWGDALKELDAESTRAEARRRRAVVLAQVAVLDDGLLLSKDQREKLWELLSRDDSDRWWSPINTGMTIAPALENLFASLAGRRLGCFIVPDSRLARILTPAQSATLKELQRQQQEVVMVEQPAGQQQPARAAPPGMAAPPMAQNVRRRIVRRGPTLEDQERRLVRYVERRVDDIDAACALSPSQRDKLSLAARLDLSRWRDGRSNAPADKLNEGEKLVVQQVQARGQVAALPLNIFNDADSYFRRALQGRLPDEQKRALEAAVRERNEFQRKALVAAVVTGFERAASLTGAQCDALASLVDDALAEVDSVAVDDRWPEWMRRLVHLSFDPMRPALFDFQISAMERQREDLANSARQFRGAWANGAR